ncbi:MAG TPA: helix-turn-helix domain-containing protein [Chthoniobacterales bacterium]|nr:helix-turn-helix domain-containing protein [Chthoniobacterales bacterium]
MRVEPNIAQLAALFGEPSRSAMLTVLLDGRSLPAGELARATGVSATAASGHLAKLVDGNLLAVEVEGRHRYYRLAGSKVATVIEELAQLAGRPAILSLPKLSPDASALRLARSCYDHLAGELAVAIASALEKRNYLVRGEGKRYEMGGTAARRWFMRRGMDLSALRSARYGIARQCLDWTERRPHLGGPLGAKLFAIWCEAGWLRRHRVQPRLVEVTALGRRKFREELDIALDR